MYCLIRCLFNGRLFSFSIRSHSFLQKEVTRRSLPFYYKHVSSSTSYLLIDMPPRRKTPDDDDEEVTGRKATGRGRAKAAPKRAAPKRRRKEESSDEEEEDDDEVLDDLESDGEFDDDEQETTRPKPSSASPGAKRSQRVALKESQEQQKNAPVEKLKLEWNEEGSFLALDSPLLQPNDKVVAFDLDSTLVEPKSGAKFPQNRKDWKWLYPDVPKKLKELYHDKGYKIVIFTNQAGIEKGKQRQDDITGKIIDIAVELGFPIQAFVSSATDHYRKPNTTMWNLFIEKHNGGKQVDLKASTFVGDAAGRAKGWKSGARKDFSTGDRAFAHNIGLEFKTPEEFFLEEAAAPFEWDSVDPHKILENLKDSKPHTEEDLFKGITGPELVVFTGRPASGKSSFAKKWFVPKGYVHVNQDTLKTKPKCISATRDALKAGKSVVVDNTNADASVRGEYTAIAKEMNIPYRCFWFDTDLDLAHHLNFYREKITNGAVRRIPDVGYNTFKSRFSEPSTETEGWSEVRKIQWTPDFASEEHKKLFLQRT
eukprot:TRINITY_DN404_c0_g1_i1.p1 TRINITY_DN404_c0_g1~~TRINITY_DN404_c0_g1_i1.p1  ORF type:complete len:539 (+),score=163.75 TRINITY_DN404_c0_g1_i1:1629-3245(+)